MKNGDDSHMNNTLDDWGQEESDLKDVFISKKPEIKEEKEGWYTDQESNKIENNLNDMADDGDHIENESALRFEMS